jgi:Tol biopolymer transport system component
MTSRWTTACLLVAVACVAGHRLSDARRPDLVPIAWLDSGVVYGRYDLTGTGREDVSDVLCDSSGLYITPGAVVGSRFQSSSAICSALWTGRPLSLSMRQRALLFSDTHQAGQVTRIDLGRPEAIVVLRKCVVEPSTPAWSPDGNRFAVGANCSGDDGSATLHVASADGSGVAPVGSPRDSLREDYPSWSPDAAQIAISRGSALSSDSIAVVDVHSGHRRVLTRGFEPSWSVRGDWIAYFRLEAGRNSVPSVRVIRPDGRDDQLLFAPRDTGASAWPLGPLLWSPDGHRVAFSRGDSMWVVSLDTHDAHSLFQVR